MNCRFPVADYHSTPLACSRCAASVPSTASRRHQRAFSFIEVLFAVMILGIGLVMLAAMLPVAARQTQWNGEETVAAGIGRTSIVYLGTVADNQMLPRTAPPLLKSLDAMARSGPQLPPFSPGLMLSFHDPRLAAPSLRPQWTGIGDWTGPAAPSEQQRDLMWGRIADSLIVPSDPRYAWIPLYRRDRVHFDSRTAYGAVGEDAALAQVIILVVRCRNRPLYDRRDLVHVGTFPATLEPTLLQARFTRGSGASPSTIQFSPSNPADAGRLAADAFVIMSDDGGDGSLNGRIFRLGNPAAAPSGPFPLSWELAPGYEMSAIDPLVISNARVFVVGRGYADPANPAAGFDGLAQDVAVYTGFVPIRR